MDSLHQIPTSTTTLHSHPFFLLFHQLHSTQPEYENAVAGAKPNGTKILLNGIIGEASDREIMVVLGAKGSGSQR